MRSMTGEGECGGVALIRPVPQGTFSRQREKGLLDYILKN
jgi:hypothetical protein